MDYLKKSKVFYVIILIFSSLLLLAEIGKITIVSKVLTITVNTLLVPLIVALFLYYILKPLYLILLKWTKLESISLIGTFLVLFLAIYFLIREFMPLLFAQIHSITNQLPKWIEELDYWVLNSELFGRGDVQHYLSLINKSFEDLIGLAFLGLQGSASLVLNVISGSFLVVSIVPLLVLFMLKNTNKEKKAPRWVSKKYRATAENFFYDVERALSDYIGGKAVVCFYVFLGALLTFKLAGLQGALVFAVVAGIFDIIPYFGPWFGIFPAVLSALVSPNSNVFTILIGILIVQLGESYIVSPYIMSKELKLHPLVVIIVLLITGQAFGIIGMIIILPILAVLKVTLNYSIKFVRLNKKIAEDKSVKEQPNEK